MRHPRNSIKGEIKVKIEQILENQAGIPPSGTIESSRGLQNEKLDSPTKSEVPEHLDKKQEEKQLSRFPSGIMRSDTRKKSDIFVQPLSENQRAIGRLLRSWPWTVLISVLTFYTLFSDDIKVLLFRPASIFYFDLMIYVAAGIFTLEIILGVFANRDYLFSFYFFLDILSTLTMLLDLSVVARLLTGPFGKLNNLFRSAKTARLGARAGRLTRVLRVVGVLRLSKVFKEAEKVRQNKIDKFDKQLKKKREEREKEAKRIKEQFADLESLR